MFKIMLESDTGGSNKPFIGVLEVDSKQDIQAYGIELALILSDYSYHHRTTKHKGRTITHTYSDTKVMNIEEKMIVKFEDRICHEGKHDYPFTFEVPPVFAPTVIKIEKEPLCKLEYFLRA